MIALVYVAATGEGLRTLTGPASQVEANVDTGAGEAWIEIAEPVESGAWLVVDDALEAREAMPVEVDGDTVTCPVGAAWELVGYGVSESGSSADGELAFSFRYPGPYRLRLEAFPYLPWEGEIGGD